MAKAKIAKKSTFIDMTPMVDLAFLLITFFMLTIKFTKAETEQVSIPSATAEKTVPAKNLLTIYGNAKGQVRVGISEQGDIAKDWLLNVAAKYNVKFTEDQVNKFAILSEVPVPIKYLPQYLDADPTQRMAIYKQYGGIPYDSTDNQLDTWVFQARMASKRSALNQDYRIAVKADQNMPYPVLKDIIKTLKKQNANKFSLITNKEALPK